MFLQMFRIGVSVVSAPFLVPFWIACSGAVVAGACAVVIKGMVVGVN